MIKAPCLTVHQPWAHLLVMGHKRFETRGWSPSRLNQNVWLCIHAGKSFGEVARDICLRPKFRSFLPRKPHNLTLGAILGIAHLEGVYRTSEIAMSISEQEYIFGDYRPGRFAWHFDKVLKLACPIPVRGNQGIWYFNMDEHDHAELYSKLTTGVDYAETEK